MSAAIWNAPPPTYDNHSTLTPYLQLPHLLSLTWLAYPILSLIFVAFRLQLSLSDAQNGIANAKTDLLASCRAAEKSATAAASMPRYMALATNKQFADAVNDSMKGARFALILALTVMEAVINFIIDTYRSTFLCFLELVVRGGLSIAISAVQELNKVVQSVASGLRTSIQSDIHNANSAITNAINVINKANPFGHITAPQIAVPNLDSLQNVTLPPSFQQALTNLNSTIPSVAHIKNLVQDLVDAPFEIVKKDINDTFAGLTFDHQLLPVPDQNLLSFCHELDTSVVDAIGRDLITAAKIGVFILLLLALLLIGFNCLLIWYKWRCMKRHLEYIRQSWMTDPTLVHPTTSYPSAPQITLGHPTMLDTSSLSVPQITLEPPTMTSSLSAPEKTIGHPTMADTTSSLSAPQKTSRMSDPTPTPMHTTSSPSAPQITLSDHNLMMLHAISAHPLVTKILNLLSRRIRMTPSQHINLMWFFHYVFHPPALACFLIGFFGLLSVEIQLLALGPIVANSQGRATAAVSDFSNVIAQSINQSMYNQSSSYASQINGKVDNFQTTINDGVFGWVNGSTTTINTTINNFYTELQHLVSTVFNGTILETPANDFLQCFIGGKVVAIEHALTFLHDNLHINIARVSPDVLVLSSHSVHEATAPIAAAAIGGGANDKQSLLGRLVTTYEQSLKKERVMFSIFMGLWGIVVLMAISVILWNSYGKAYMYRRGWRKWNGEQRSGTHPSSVESGGQKNFDKTMVESTIPQHMTSSSRGRFTKLLDIGRKITCWKVPKEADEDEAIAISVPENKPKLQIYTEKGLLADHDSLSPEHIRSRWSTSPSATQTSWKKILSPTKKLSSLITVPPSDSPPISIKPRMRQNVDIPVDVGPVYENPLVPLHNGFDRVPPRHPDLRFGRDQESSPLPPKSSRLHKLQNAFAPPIDRRRCSRPLSQQWLLSSKGAPSDPSDILSRSSSVNPFSTPFDDEHRVKTANNPADARKSTQSGPFVAL